MSDAHKDVLERANAAIATGDIEGFLAYCTDDTKWTFVGEQTLRGKEEVRRYMATAYKDPPSFQTERMIAEGDDLIALGEITFRDKTGKLQRHDFCDVWRFRNGQLAQLKAFVIADV